VAGFHPPPPGWFCPPADILNWFAAQKEFSAGIVEGLNYRVKLTIRKAYGFRTLEAAEIALYHALGRLPEPKLTHEFC